MKRFILVALLALACGLAQAQTVYQASGKTVTVTAATSAPTPVQAVGANNPTMQYLITNIGSNYAFMSYGATAAVATTNCVIPTGTAQLVYVSPPFSVINVTATGNAFWCGLTSAGTSVIYITPGAGM